MMKKLKERFRSIDIEELKGIGFHQKMQKEESVKQLVRNLIIIFLKGRFFQALHTKWQQKLGAPKPAETFNELYDRVRINSEKDLLE